MRLAWLLPILAACTPAATRAPVDTARSADGSPPIAAAPRPRTYHKHAEPPPAAPTRLLAIDWSTTAVTTDAEALALWRRIAPTGADYDAKLAEIPTDQPIARGLAVALLHEGNFACPAAPRKCGGPPIELVEPRPDATLADPCLRRLVALWAIDQLEPQDVAGVRPALRAMVALPPPESQLVAAALALWPEGDQDARLAVVDVAWQAGQRELVNATIAALDEPHLIAAATTHHIDGAVEVLSPTAHRAVYLAAIADDRLQTKTRVAAMREIAGDPAALHIPPDARAALAKAARSPDCEVAAVAARWLDADNDHRFVPTRPASPGKDDAAMMRGLCVLAHWDRLDDSPTSTLLESYVPKAGLQLLHVTYDPLSDTDPDGDGDVHTEHVFEHLDRAAIELPNLEDVGRALANCRGTVCASDAADYRFTFATVGGVRVLTRLEVDDHVPCSEHSGVAP